MTMYKGTRVSQLAEARVTLRTALNAQVCFEVEMDDMVDLYGAWPSDSASRFSELEEEVWIARAKLQKLLDKDPVNEGVV